MRPVSIVSGDATNLVLMTTGDVYAWGSSIVGALGLGTTLPADPGKPTRITGLQNITQITAQDSLACALDTGGLVYCWGRNFEGAVGNGKTAYGELSPQRVQGLSNITKVVAGPTHACAVDTKGDLYCWGDHDISGASASGVGCGVNGAVTSPCKVPVSGVVDLSLGTEFTCILKTDGTVWCWGRNDASQLGSTSPARVNTPPGLRVKGLTKVKGLVSWRRGTCALTSQAATPLLCWGEAFGETIASPALPKPLSTPKTVDGLALNSFLSCYIEGGLTTPARLVCAGCPEFYKGLFCKPSQIFFAVQGLDQALGSSSVVGVSIGLAHACVISARQPYCWGEGLHYALGQGTSKKDSKIPLPVIAP